MLRARAALRHHKDVLAVLHVWWQTAQRSMQSGGDTLASALAKGPYVEMMLKVYKCMIREFDEAEARECADEDWARDSDNGADLDRERFSIEPQTRNVQCAKRDRSTRCADCVLCAADS